jgi:hypothetical protein
MPAPQQPQASQIIPVSYSSQVTHYDTLQLHCTASRHYLTEPFLLAYFGVPTEETEP